MAEYDPNFKDESGLLTVFLGLAVLVGMSALPATIAWVQLLG
ncbi:hypothetical protein L861_21115 [Litchfieldella anticariensis FP35 = DSM 16096]|uniref:Uncharacterized protein n=1 Tax=Litchfieldella anticariensis (strain DSM 16096 / CECT 5854 / CIP 108499 / LMG 22089 / FP35) TaxID=1121939 RepID=S2KID2_LITA3|nr:hypothetical protein [Halomonas anticariensis]EPC01730.1 hypothetical protein L861_21115 [Halomonas anticariensis FP35 = DSM 16096]